MAIKLHNTLTKQTDLFQPITPGQVSIYSCGPTVYDNVHIGNLSAFIIADTLQRMLKANDLTVTHAMNLTDVDDKTIQRSQQMYSDETPHQALSLLTSRYSEAFFQDMQAIGNSIDSLTFVRATDEKTINGMRDMVQTLYDKGFAYLADDGVYFSIEAYQKAGHHYGQLTDITAPSQSEARIANDEYDKDNAQDFALWKKQKADEPSWEFTLDGRDVAGRPGWHLECSVMSRQVLGQPFDIHTGGIDLVFPHHENELAQSTATHETTLAQYFVHNEHILVDGKKMSKSLNNFYTLKDLREQQVEPLAFRLLVLQSHYRRPTHFSFDNVRSASNRLHHWRNVAALRHQTHDTLHNDHDKATDDTSVSLYATSQALVEALSNDLDTPQVLLLIDEAFSRLLQVRPASIHQAALTDVLETIDALLGLQLMASTPDISDDNKRLILERQRARENQDWSAADTARDALLAAGITVRDTAHGSIWEYV